MKIWGAPVNLDGPAFRISKPADRKRHWGTNAERHRYPHHPRPPFGVLDVEYGTQEHAGDPELLEAVNRVKPRLHVRPLFF